MNNARTDVRAKGSCLCGGVRYEVRGPLRDVIACHCSQCRRTTGHFMAATAAKRAHFTVTRDDGLRWYQSSKAARRGFFGTCGAVLFWEGQGLDYISIAAGTLDVPTGLKIVRHIYAGDKSDYYGPYGYNIGYAVVQLLKNCGDNLTRENIMRQASHLNMELPLLLPGIRLKTTPADLRPIRQMRLVRFDGERYVLFSDVLVSE